MACMNCSSSQQLCITGDRGMSVVEGQSSVACQNLTGLAAGMPGLISCIHSVSDVHRVLRQRTLASQLTCSVLYLTATKPPTLKHPALRWMPMFSTHAFTSHK